MGKNMEDEMEPGTMKRGFGVRASGLGVYGLGFGVG